MLAAAAVAVAGIAAASGRGGAPMLRFRVFAWNVPRADGIVWTGRRFLFVQNTANVVWAAPAAGAPLTRFAQLPRLVEEARCVLSPGAGGFAPGAVFCHAPNHAIYELTPGGGRRLFATLPGPATPASDGALAYDDVGRFGHTLVAATGRSGARRPAGGSVYTISPRGRVHLVGTYMGSGGADEVAIAPSSLGAASGDALLTVDAGAAGGSLVAMTPAGATRTLATFADGPNPVLTLPRTLPRVRREPSPGLYLTDDETPYVYHAPLAPLARYAGDLLVGTESRATFWIVRPSGSGFAKVPVATNFAQRRHSVEAALVVP